MLLCCLVYELQFPHKFDSEKAVENTELLEVIQLGTCWMLLVLEECVHHRKTRVSKHNLYYAVNI